MGRQRKLVESIKWYTQTRPLFEALAIKAATTIEELLRLHGTNFHSVVHRTKTLASFEAKANGKGYSDPSTQIKDLAAVRVTCYVKSDVKEVCKLLETTFVVDHEHSLDKSTALAVDQMGYQSMHYVVAFDATRLELPEYRRFHGLQFEVQARTILQDAWAEIEHDRNYKFQGVLPPHLKRRFAILAGVLEMADREFEAISVDIDAYSEQIKSDADSGILSIEINTVALREFLNVRLERLVEAGLQASFGPQENSEQLIEELRAFGIDTLSDLDTLVTAVVSEEDDMDYFSNTNFAGFLRDVMIANDWQRYFERAWQGHWRGTDPESLDYWKKHGVPTGDILNRYDIWVTGDEG